MSHTVTIPCMLHQRTMKSWKLTYFQQCLTKRCLCRCIGAGPATPDGQLELTGSPPTMTSIDLEVGAASTSGVAASSPSTAQGRRILEVRRSLLQDDDIVLLLADSGSEGESDADQSDEDTEEATQMPTRAITHRLRHEVIARTEGLEIEHEFDVDDFIPDECVMDESVVVPEDLNVLGGHEPVDVGEVFQWAEDFNSFTGQQETYLRQPGPAFISNDPTEIFLRIWDVDVMGLIASETNKYARLNIEQYSNRPTVPKYLGQWADVTIDDLYKYFALLIIYSSYN
ncbi:unnamed protein product [Leptidea sinapis]|uniref:PiggyBac transposable element-derived protein domain-containing protein n=1 Tax=Leptidea sinapis TaxID=189913 RepID=A0A5E4Q1X1_9NEOP|nr:unnamed protein product [Leptidea sinapis]